MGDDVWRRPEGGGVGGGEPGMTGPYSPLAHQSSAVGAIVKTCLPVKKGMGAEHKTGGDRKMLSR